ncbi:MBL fold metallo-hydrolase [Halobellus salinus]|uniref:MBL fold metallo-hydrolase n=1 Tax=Halobellus salinus TaxID=931585 RepID=UPI00240363B2|nr:Glyoxylase, beta-lactamase superfamily II [Halobellus salinus]
MSGSSNASSELSNVARGIIRVPVPVTERVPTGATNAYLLADELLIDPAGRTDDLDAAVDAAGIEHVAVTHAHPDHVGAVDAYAAETDATVWCRRGFESRFAAAAGIEPDRIFSEGTEIPVDGGIRVIDTQGHAPDHVAFEAEGGTVCGDVAVAAGSVAVAAPEGDLRGYLIGLRRLHARTPSRLLPGHGPIIDDPQATCRRLIAHRLDRERRVVAAVREGAADIDAVVNAAYDKDLSGFEDLARATAVAHLEKLDVEGRVAFNPETGAVTPT